MRLLTQAFGALQTNCYLLKTSKGDFIIDPGIGASQWVLENVTNPLAILVTHGHYDHIYSLADLKMELLGVPIYCPQDDAFMLESDCFDTGLTPCAPDFLVEGNKTQKMLNISDTIITYHHFPGHTPGCSMIEIEEMFFSGDFIFYRSIGRCDFSYSNPMDMKDSLERFIHLSSDIDKVIYPGHGQKTSLFVEQENAKFWIHRL